MPRKRTNAVHRHFEWNDNDKTSSCKLCERKIKGNHATNLLNHLLLKHQTQHEEVIQINKNVRTEKPQPKKKTDGGEENKKIQKVTDCCIKLVAIHGRPFELLEDEAFREILGLISPNALEVANPRKIKVLVTDKAYEIRDKIETEVHKRLISIKMDSATCMDRQFVGINAQYVKDSKIVVRNLAVLEMFGRQTSENLKCKLLEVLTHFRIPLSNIYSITTDNGANYLKVAKLLNENNNCSDEQSVILYEDSDVTDTEQESDIETGNEPGEMINVLSLNESAEQPRSFEIRSLPCAAHTLQLCIKDALKKDRESESLIETCRHVVKILRRPLMNLKIKKENLKKPLLDCLTRWTSTYYMLKRLTELKTICNESNEIAALIDDDTWIKINDIILCLEPSKEATIRLQGEQVTLTDFYSIWVICKTKTEINSLQLAKEIVAAMSEREKNLLANKAFLPAIYMDPRWKTILSENEEDTGRRWLKDVYRQLVMVCESEPVSDQSSPVAISSSSSNYPMISPPDLPRDSYQADLQALDSILKETDRVHSSNTATLDFDHYLAEYRITPRLAITENVLEFWSSKKPNNPLANLALVVLGAPATQVTVERLFSTLKFILTPLRNRLLDQNLKNILFIKSNQDLF